MSLPDPVARRAAELRDRVQEVIPPGETFQAGTWVTRATRRPGAGEVARAELNPLRLAENVAAEAIGIGDPATGPDAYGDNRKGLLSGTPDSIAGHLDRVVASPAEARALVLTGHRLIVFAKQPVAAPAREPRQWLRAAVKGVGDFLRNEPGTEPLPPLRELWHCPRGALTGAATEQADRITLYFADRSSLTMVTPAVVGAPFAAAVRGQNT